MRVVVAFDARLDRTPDGRVWWDGSLEYSFWQRYLEVFDSVCVVARVRDVDGVPSHARQIDGPRVTVASVPFFAGPWQFAMRQLKVRRAIRGVLRPDDAVILRVPSTVATCLEDVVRGDGRPYAVEVIADPYDIFAPGSVRSSLRPVMRWWFPRRLRRQCAGACAAAYVTTEFLQRRYPPGAGAYAVSCSDVDLRDDAYVADPRPIRERAGPLKLVFVGSLEQLHKGVDVLVEAIGRATGNGCGLELAVIGDGRHRAELTALAAARGVVDRARFLGRLPSGSAVRDQLDQADVFVLPSHSEGLPRALVEAMARALPCVASAVGGIPELLPREDLVPPGDPAALAAKLADVAKDHQRLARMSARSLQTARGFRANVLWARRRAFYEAVRDLTAQPLRCR